MSTPSTALEGIAARPAPGQALKIVPARHPLQRRQQTSLALVPGCTSIVANFVR